MNMAPLPHEYMLTGIIGFFVTIFMVSDSTWKFTLSLFFLLFIIASLVSLSTASHDESTLNIIASEPYQRKKRKVIK